jgi:hypothetical protein
MIEQATEDLVQKMRVSDLSAIYKGNSLAYQAS